MILIERFGGRGSVDVRVRLRSGGGSSVEAQGTFGEGQRPKAQCNYNQLSKGYTLDVVNCNY